MGVKEYQFAGDEIQKHLNKVFKPAVVEFEILHADFKMSELTSFSHGGSPWNSVYNDDQKRVLRAYNDSIKDGVYYLFFIDNVTDKKDGNGTMVSGYMPRGYNCGFIYDGGSPHTIAHELGHGIAGLEHVFENSKSSGKTNNLMDYASGEELWHFQWDAIQDPSRVWMKWNKDEGEGEKTEWIYPNEKCQNIYLIFSPYFSRKFQVLMESDDKNLISTLNQWASRTSKQVFLNQRASEIIFNNIYVSDPDDYRDRIEIFKSQFNKNGDKIDATPIVKYYFNGHATDYEHVAVYCLNGVTTNINTLADFKNIDEIYIQEPYLLSRYEILNDSENGAVFKNTTKSYFQKATEGWIDSKIKNCGVFHLDFSASAEAGTIFTNAGVSATCGIGFDFKGGVALFGNAQFFANFLNYGFEINIDNFRKPLSSYNTTGFEKSWVAGGAFGLFLFFKLGLGI